MVFKVAARTLLELGADLISSDAVAIYELVKNGIDARSTTGVTVEFSIALRHSDYVDALGRASDLERRRLDEPAMAANLDEIKIFVGERIVPTAPSHARQNIVEALESAMTPDMLGANLRAAYVKSNMIEFRDTGHGMSHSDLTTAYLMIGTPSRRREIDRAVLAGREAPYLGEKGIGRLSAMRLGSRLHVETATSTDHLLNVLDIDWSSFDDLEKLIGDVSVEPTEGPPKPNSKYSGTTIRISDLTASWSPQSVRDITRYELARLIDPLNTDKRRFRIVIMFNGERIDVPRLDRTILDFAQARVSGRYEIGEAGAQLEANLWCRPPNTHPQERRTFLEQVDLRALTSDPDTEVSASALRSVGPFTFEFYWFNRRVLHAIDGIGDRRQVLELQRQWSGIMLFRNGYRVFPYGDESDDWLGLDRRALAAPGYKLNRAQFVGRVTISRTQNPHLVDQTSREGLKDCPEKAVLIEILRYIIQNRLRSFLDEVEAQQKHVDIDIEATERRIELLEKRARTSIRELEKRHQEERPQLQELLTTFGELQAAFARAKARTEEVESERDRMIQLAGIGLMLEVVAHELARSTEHTLRMLEENVPPQLPADVSSLFRALRDEMKTMNKRLRVLDPLSVSGRQRKETFGLASLVRDIFEGHAAQFKRHGIDAKVTTVGGFDDVRIQGVRGMFVQIIENLLQNSIYWMELRRKDEDDYKPQIAVTIGPAPLVIEYTDNGPGIQPSLRDEVFKPFFSTKGKSRRQGLGLFIARDCVEYHGGHLYLSDERKVHAGRLNTFNVELPADASKPS